MRRVLSAGWIPLLATLAAGRPAAAQQPSPPQAVVPGDIITQATRVIELIRDGKYVDVTQLWDAKMLEALPAEKVEGFWTQLVGQVGHLKSIGTGKVIEQAPFRTVILPLTFEQMELNAAVTFDADGKVAGFLIRPKDA